MGCLDGLFGLHFLDGSVDLVRDVVTVASRTGRSIDDEMSINGLVVSATGDDVCTHVLSQYAVCVFVCVCSLQLWSTVCLLLLLLLLLLLQVVSGFLFVLVTSAECCESSIVKIRPGTNTMVAHNHG